MRLGLCVDGTDPADARTKCMIEAVKFAERAIELIHQRQMLILQRVITYQPFILSTVVQIGKWSGEV